MKTYSTVRLSVVLVLAVIFISGTNVLAQGIKERMRARLPEIVALKSEGIVGEDNSGYLEFRGSTRKKADIVAAENNDRRQVYSAIAKQQGTSAEVVGTLRAKQIAEKAEHGEWLQDQQGKWYRK